MKKLLLLALLLASPVMADAQFGPLKCEVQPLWADERVRGSYSGLMGSFEAQGDEVEIVRTFRLEKTNLIATVGVSFVEEYSKKPPRPHKIELAIAVSDKEQTKIFGSVESSEASTRYAKKWNVSVTKNIHFDNATYMFTFRCWDAAGFGKQRPFFD